VTVFSVRCPAHGRWVLHDATDILSLEPAPGGGFTIGYRCSCGHEGQWPPAAGEVRWNERMAG
jgi:lysyl-tRNA synthetase class I